MASGASASGSDPSAASPAKRSRSTRISQLASRFEHPPTRTSAADTTPPKPSDIVIDAPTTLARSRSRMGGGAVERNVRRFSADTRTLESGTGDGTAGLDDEIRRHPLNKVSTTYVAGSIGGMDWKPRTKPPASSPASLSIPSPPPPIARFLHPHAPMIRSSTSASTSVSAATTTKATPAETITIPASVTTTPFRGETKLAIPRHKATKRDEEASGRSEPHSVLFEIDRRVVEVPAPSLGPSQRIHAHSFNTVSSASPSFATSEATVVEVANSSGRSVGMTRSRPSPPSAGTHSSSGSTLTVLSKSASNHVTKPYPASLVLPSTPTIPLTSPPLRPSLSRGATSVLTNLTDVTHSYPSHEIFTPNAAPLHLPDLDKLLETLEPPHFSETPALHIGEGGAERSEAVAKGIELDDREGKAFQKGYSGRCGTEEERKSWDDWVRGDPPSLWSKLVGHSRKGTATDGDQERLIDGQHGLTREQARRKLVFPPFHRLPRDATLTDLKSNIRKPPPMFSGNALLQTAADGALNLFGSAAGIRMTTVEGIRDLMQMCTLLVTSASPSLSLLAISADSRTAATSRAEASTTFRTVLITIPSALSLDFASAFGHAFLFLLGFTCVSFLALYEFYRFTGGWRGPVAASRGRARQSTELDLGEGYDRQDVHVVRPNRRRRRVRDGRAWKVFVTFYLTSIYLPLSKLALSALFWERGYWPSQQLVGTNRNDDRCFSTVSSGRRGFNAAVVIVPVAFAILVTLGGWFPVRMYRVVERSKPTVDRWTELGELRRDRKGEYERLLDKDPSPYSFLYREYRREWASFRSVYMSVKLVNVFIVVLISNDNCVFLDRYSESKLDVVRQATLLVFMTAFFALDVYSRPQLDEISNRSDRISRLGYVGISLCGLLVALRVPGRHFWDGSAIVLINAFSYSFNFYFAIIGTQLVRRLIKRIQRRLDFSIDVFSPELDLSKHISRRIWQETFSTLLFTAPEFSMAPSKKLEYAGPPPYLLNFGGSVAERHAENLKILREIGLDAYCDASVSDDADGPGLEDLRRLLQYELAGPDVYFRPRSSPNLPPAITTFFGRLDIVPFPFTALFHYDQSPSFALELSSRADLEELVRQQTLPTVRLARKVRTALRALEGQKVYCPRIHVESAQGQRGRGGRKIEYARPVTYTFATIKIRCNSGFAWRGYNHSSGFEVTFEWTDGIGFEANDPAKLRTDLKLVLSGVESGIVSSDFSPTKPLAVLLHDNRELIDARVHLVEDQISTRRRFFADEADEKRKTLSYDFLMSVFFEAGLSRGELDARLAATEANERVRNLVKNHPTTFTALEERIKAVSTSTVASWWYVMWDDLYRRNAQVFADVAHDFSPHYKTSICYHPMPRARLEAFLNERGFSTKARAYFSTGFLNQIYFVLDELAFASSGQAVPIHLASPLTSSSTLRLDTPIRFSSLAEKLAHRADGEPSSPTILSRFDEEENERTTAAAGGGGGSRLTAGTGDGTNEDDRYIRSRRAFRFEQIWVEVPRPRFVVGRRREWTEHFVRVRIKRGIARWLGWTLNETNAGERQRKGLGRKRPRDDDYNEGEGEAADEVLLDLRRVTQGWTVSRQGHE